MKKLFLLTLMAIAIQAQAQNVGIGNPAPAEKLDVTGNINVTGTIKANGVDGTAGQVLSKNNTNNLAWSNTAFTNTTRFKCRFSNNDSPGAPFQNFSSPTYNLNTGNVIISPNGITINKAGLYHFDIFVQTNAETADNPAEYPFIFIDFTIENTPPHDVFNIYSGLFSPINNLNNFWSHNAHLTFEQYIQAPSVINIRATSLNTNTLEVYGSLIGHLISE